MTTLCTNKPCDLGMLFEFSFLNCKTRGCVYVLRECWEDWVHVNNVLTEETGTENQMWLFIITIIIFIIIIVITITQCFLFCSPVPEYTFPSTSSHLHAYAGVAKNRFTIVSMLNIEFILVLSFLNYCFIFYGVNCKLILPHPIFIYFIKIYESPMMFWEHKDAWDVVVLAKGLQTIWGSQTLALLVSRTPPLSPFSTATSVAFLKCILVFGLAPPLLKIQCLHETQVSSHWQTFCKGQTVNMLGFV